MVQGIDSFRSDMSEAAQIAFADKLDGKELRVDNSSVLGRIFAIVSRPLVENAEILPQILQSLDINSAEGQQLDNLLWNIHRIKRLGESRSTGYAILYGDLGTFVDKGSKVGNSITRDVYKTDSSVTMRTINTNGVDIVFDDVGGVYTLSYNIQGYLSSSPQIIVEQGSKDVTVTDIAERFVDAVNNQSSYLYAYRNSDNSVKVNILDENMVGDFSVGGMCRITRSYMPVYITSDTYNSQESKSKQVNNILTPKLGWRGVYNPFYIFPSRGVESDEDYRRRGKLRQSNSSGKYTSILMALKSVKGVVYENVQQNTSSNITNSGIINNGIAVTVMGGNEEDIALAIFNSISEGIATSGDIMKMVKDINGFEHEIRFSRPKLVPLEISMSLITYPNFPINGNARIRQAIIEWFNNLDVGEDIHYSRLYEPINSIQGFAVKNLKFGYKGGTLSLEDIIIRHDEIATLNAEDIVIGGSRGSKNIVDTTPTPETPPVPEVCNSTGYIDFVSDGVIPDWGNARYRINGGSWVDFSKGKFGDKDVLQLLFEDINSTAGKELVYTGIDLESTSHPFYAPQGQGFFVAGEAVISDNNYFQFSVGQLETNIIELEGVEGINSNIVRYMFGSDSITLTSCAHATWAAR